jgi:hypothetical protein
MPGEDDLRKYHKLLTTVQSTPVANTQGVNISVPFAKLSPYTVNMRSFHPNKNFEKLGFRFHGDDRGFSTEQSYFGDDIPAGSVTSRIWQRFKFDAGIQQVGDLTQVKSSALETESNTSAPGPWLWSVMGHKETYKSKNLKPRGKLEVTHALVPHGAQKELGLKSWYGGENHAFIGSSTMQKKADTTYVPTLDVFAEMFIRVERIQLYMDIYSLVYGDGFPNGEGFITDQKGQHVMLGTHVRIGAPATHLWGKGDRLMWANALRIEIDAEGNFGEKLWVFAQALGGPAQLRDEYFTSKSGEHCVVGAKTDYDPSGPFSYLPPTFTWDCAKPQAITQKAADAPRPLHLSAFNTVDQVREQLQQVWYTPPIYKGMRAEWNNSQLRRDPNAGREPDSYDVSPDKWKK